MIDIEWTATAEGAAPDMEARQWMEDAVRAAWAYLNIGRRGEVGVRLASNEEVRLLNSTYRGVDKVTDVLSFPAARFDASHRLLRCDVNPQTRAVIFGDIVISLHQANAQAEEYGHGFARELAYLTVHAMLHLAGYDHVEESGQAQMRSAEETILTTLGLAREGGMPC